MTGNKSKDVDSYITKVPEPVRGKLGELRAAIRSVVPDALEKISYGMPYYGYKGRLAYFSLAKKHIGLYIVPPVIAQHKKELSAYKTATATIQFPLDKKLPLGLIKKLIKERKLLNEKKAARSYTK